MKIETPLFLKQHTADFLALIVLLTAVNANADGTHGSKVCVRNDTSGKLAISAYNGSDSVCVTAHKTGTVKPGETVHIKCHGQGKHRCKIKAGYMTSCRNFDDNATMRVWATKNTNTIGWTQHHEVVPDVVCE